MVGDIGEEELYSEYRKAKDLYNFLCIEYTKDCAKKDKEELWWLEPDMFWQLFDFCFDKLNNIGNLPLKIKMVFSRS